MLSGWTNKIIVTLTASAAIPINAPVPIQFRGSMFDFASAKADGTDIRATLPDDTLLNFWRRPGKYSQAGKTGEVWIKMPQAISGGQSLTVWLQYGNPAASDASSYDNTFAKIDNATAGIESIYHYDNVLTDPVAGRTLTGVNAPTFDASDGGTNYLSDSTLAFASGSCRIFDGVNQHDTQATLLDTVPADGGITFWVQPTAGFTNGCRLLSKYNKDSADAVYEGIELWIENGVFRAQMGIASVFTILSGKKAAANAGEWHMLTLAWGAAGFRLYVDDELDAIAPSQLGKFANGTRNDFTIAAYKIDGGTTNFSKVKIDELTVWNQAVTSQKVVALCQRRHDYMASTLRTRLTFSGTPIANVTNAAIEENSKHEPALPLFNITRNKWMLPTTDAWSANKIGVNLNEAATLDTVFTLAAASPYVIAQPLWGQGHNQVTGVAARAEWFADPTNANLIHAMIGHDASVQPIKHYTAAASDLNTWTRIADAIAYAAQSWFTTPYNSSILRDVYGNVIRDSDGLYKMMFDAAGTGGAPAFASGLATSNDLVAWTLYANNPLGTLRLKTGIYGAMHWVKFGGEYILMQSPSALNLTPSNCRLYRSADAINWQEYPFGPVTEISGGTFGVDQTSDPAFFENANKFRLFYDQLDNTGSVSRPYQGIYNGTFSDWLQGDSLTTSIAYAPSPVPIIGAPMPQFEISEVDVTSSMASIGEVLLGDVDHSNATIEIENTGPNPLTDCSIQIRAHVNGSYVDWLTSVHFSATPVPSVSLLYFNTAPSALAALSRSVLQINHNRAYSIRVMAKSALGTRARVRGNA